MTALPVVLIAAALSSGCTDDGGEADPQVASTSAAVAAVDEVADAQATTDAQLTEAVRRLRSGDETVRRVRAPATFEVAVAELEEVRDEVDGLVTDPAEEGLADLRTATDRALDAVAQAGEDAEEAGDAWLAEYLAAEQRVLEAVRAHADTGEELLAAVGPHREALLDTLEAVRSNLEGRDDPEEAVAAIELEVLPLLEELVEAQARTAEANRDRAASAEALNQASADAAAVAERRPSR